MKITPYLSLARPDNWPKNFVILLGVVMAHVLTKKSVDPMNLILTFFAICFASSANYVLNNSIDTTSDAYHPIKKHRATAKNILNYNLIACEYAIFLTIALMMGWFINYSVFIVLVIYIICSWVYNVPPIRCKDKAYLDVILESINYPLRVLVGWLCVLPNTQLPSSIIIITWSMGAFTMSLKRLAELQLFENQNTAALYRHSYSKYTTNSLAVCGFVYAMFTVFGMTILLLKYKIELILIMPVMIILLAWYFLMGLRHSLFIVYPERLLSNKVFIGLCIAMLITAGIALQIKIPFLNILALPLDFSN